VATVEVFLPSPLLAEGLCLVDTPGIGSVVTANTAATRAFVPHIDAALVVVGPDPPISADELDLAAEVAGEAGDLIVVLNKADLAPAEHRREVAAFTARVLEERLGRAVGPLLEVSARERLERGSPTRDWAALEGRLRRLTGDRARQLAEAAAVRTARRLGQRLIAELDEQDAALRRPIAELEARVQRLRTALADADRWLRDLRFLFDAVEADLTRAVEGQQQQFVRESLPALQSRLAAWVEQHGGVLRGASLRRAACSEARQIAAEAVDRWLSGIEPYIESLYRDATARFFALAAEYLGRVAADAPGLALDADALPPDQFDGRRGFYFASLMYLTASGPRAWLIDRLAPRALRERDVARAAGAYLARLLDTNAHRVESDLRDRTQASRQRLERAIRRELADALDAAGRSLSAAMAGQRMAEDEVRDRLEHLRRLREMARELLAPSP
jgi:phage shock protein A